MREQREVNVYILETGGGPYLLNYSIKSCERRKVNRREGKRKRTGEMKKEKKSGVVWSIEQMKKEDRGSKEACVENIGDSWKKPLSLSTYGEVIIL